MSIDALLNLVIVLVIAGVIFWLLLWFIDWVGVPEPFNKVLKVVIGLVALLMLVKMLLGLGTFHLGAVVLGTMLA